MGDDGLQLLQYELTIFSLRTPGYEWLAQAQQAALFTGHGGLR